MLKRKKIQDIEMKNKDLENKLQRSKLEGNSMSSRAPLLTFDGTQPIRQHPNITMKFTKNVPERTQVKERVDVPVKKDNHMIAKAVNRIATWSRGGPSAGGPSGSARHAPPPAGNPPSVDESGSGKGAADLMPSSIAREIVIGQRIGSGRYGTVHVGEWRKQKVAVKVFFSGDLLSCEREVEMYKTPMLRHDNILGYIANDAKDNGFYTEFWLITEYHSRGSISDYLHKVTINLEEMMRMIYGIANGLQHLHLEIIGAGQAKPSVAHRDIKPRNILVKMDGTVCIGDLGLAVRYSSREGLIEIPSAARQGTKRYMAPEVLDNSINLEQIESLKAADMWAFGLVVWEILRRVRCEYPPNYPGKKFAPGVDPRPDTSMETEHYQTPFKEYLYEEESEFDSFMKVVCHDEVRPSVPQRWLNDYLLSQVVFLMKQCWYSPAARPCAFRVKKYILELNDRTIHARLNPTESFAVE